MTPAETATVLAVAGAVAMFGLATLGLVRLPDLYARAHATSKADTLGVLFAVVAAGATYGPTEETLKLVVLLVFVLVTTPTATHAIVNAAAVEDYQPWTLDDGDGTGTEAGADDRWPDTATDGDTRDGGDGGGRS